MYYIGLSLSVVRVFFCCLKGMPVYHLSLLQIGLDFMVSPYYNYNAIHFRQNVYIERLTLSLIRANYRSCFQNQLNTP